MAQREDPDITADLELRALKRMIAARSRQIQHYVDEVRTRGRPASREDDLQLQVFVERSAQALAQAEAETSEPQETRIARLESLAKALECSWEYFAPRQSPSAAPGDAGRWSVRLK